MGRVDTFGNPLLCCLQHTLPDFSKDKVFLFSSSLWECLDGFWLLKGMVHQEKKTRDHLKSRMEEGGNGIFFLKKKRVGGRLHTMAGSLTFKKKTYFSSKGINLCIVLKIPPEWAALKPDSGQAVWCAWEFTKTQKSSWNANFTFITWGGLGNQTRVMKHSNSLTKGNNDTLAALRTLLWALV